jgi:hypothetical protein
MTATSTVTPSNADVSGVRAIAKQFGVDPGTVQRIPFAPSVAVG